MFIPVRQAHWCCIYAQFTSPAKFFSVCRGCSAVCAGNKFNLISEDDRCALPLYIGNTRPFPDRTISTCGKMLPKLPIFKPGESIWWRWPLVRLKYQSQSQEALVRVSEWGWRGSCRPRSGSQVSHQRLDRHCDHRQSGTEEFRVTTLWQDGTCERHVCLKSL